MTTPIPLPDFIVFGPTASGLSTTHDLFAEFGYTVISNIQPEQLQTLVAAKRSGPYAFIPRFFNTQQEMETFQQALQHLQIQDNGASSPTPTLHTLQLSAPAPIRVQRAMASGKLHPMQGKGPDSAYDLADAIEVEQQLYSGLKGAAEYALDTSLLTVPELRNKIAKLLGLPPTEQTLTVTLTSFGFKHGAPVDAELLFDMRFLKNPFYEVALRPMTGLDAPVRDYVLGLPTAKEFLVRWCDLVGLILPQFLAEGKLRVSIAIGCTGGQHRSVCMTEALASYLRTHHPTVKVVVNHRESTQWPTACKACAV